MADIGIRDVAALAGVSVATASYALNRPDRVSKKSATLVVEAARTLGYVPNTAARQLKVGRSFAIGMALADLSNPFFAELAVGAEDVAEKAGYSLLFGNSRDSTVRESRYLDLFERQRVDGVLLAPRTVELGVLERFRNRKVPVVLLDAVDPAGVIPSVSLDDVLGGRLAAQHLLDGGCRRLVFVGSDPCVAQVRDRLRGCRDAVGEGSVEVLTLRAMNVALGRSVGEALAARAARERPDGVVAANDQLALGIVEGLTGAGVRVPEDVAVIGYDDIDAADAAKIPLSSVHQPSYDMGVAAAELLLAQLDGGAGLRSVRFQPAVIARDSTRG